MLMSLFQITTEQAIDQSNDYNIQKFVPQHLPGRDSAAARWHARATNPHPRAPYVTKVPKPKPAAKQPRPVGRPPGQPTRDPTREIRVFFASHVFLFP